ncbi:hypothetical protein B0H16DRAFT_1861313 [Mycena metata]|uniref:Uncharacterized protein n=1 Tax=Mycena metata TaxID=1033252 RepID=A0AAD7N325_9AGAR|nr:hypothetical protein B0H16DRAFT_1861313 [Mycena metata]
MQGGDIDHHGKRGMLDELAEQNVHMEKLEPDKGDGRAREKKISCRWKMHMRARIPKDERDQPNNAAQRPELTAAGHDIAPRPRRHSRETRAQPRRVRGYGGRKVFQPVVKVAARPAEGKDHGASVTAPHDAYKESNGPWRSSSYDPTATLSRPKRYFDHEARCLRRECTYERQLEQCAGLPFLGIGAAPGRAERILAREISE